MQFTDKIAEIEVTPATIPVPEPIPMPTTEPAETPEPAKVALDRLPSLLAESARQVLESHHAS